MNEFSNRLKTLRENKKAHNSRWTQQFVADKIGMARSTYTAYENGTKLPPADTINNIATLLDVSNDYLMGRTDTPHQVPLDKIEEITFVPILEELIDHTNQYANEKIKGYFPTPNKLLSEEDKEYVWVEVAENNMMNIGIRKGSNVFVCLQSTVENGDLAIVKIGKDKEIIYKVYFADNTVSLINENPSFEDQILPKNKVRILGKVIGLYTLFG